MLSVKNINKSFKKNDVLKNININFEANKVTGLLGNNGVGKTTLLKIIFNELVPNDGEINLGDHQIKPQDYSKLHFFTENNELPKTLSVKEYCEYYLGLRFMKPLSKEKISQLDWIFDYNKHCKSKIERLSAGEKKMLSLFILFLAESEIYFFDEPTANLDSENKNIIITAMKYLKSENKTIIIITHLIEEVSQLLDNIVVFKDGEIVYEAKCKDLKNIKETYAKVIGQSSESEIMRKLKNEK
ncbi:ABC transporter ATP-binding protein [Spiroplasma endosymbiont of Panorpa germanica]|uniref:ABC transporter ATP-binding protein n=1 Tax=Spiroplasma endosymbiont of Panorpa germanica TaxID=3066314 RepID=UPI0030CE4936